MYGSGFPKSHNLGGDWQGWGTALKPALEPITVARKPLIGTVAANVAEHGTGAINIDACRVKAIDAAKLAKHWDRVTTTDMRGGNFVGGRSGGVLRTTEASALGRWPANLVHDGSPAADLALKLIARNLETVANDSAKRRNEKAGLAFRSALLAQPAAQHQGEPILIQAVAVTRKDDDEGLRLEWLLEGGIAEMEFAGQVLFAMPEVNDLCDEDGSAEVFLHPPTSDGFSAGDMADQGAKAFAARDPEVEALRSALQFYADRDHFSEDLGGDWDNVSGEPANILWQVEGKRHDPHS